jgi:hypothetical protein
MADFIQEHPVPLPLPVEQVAFIRTYPDFVGQPVDAATASKMTARLDTLEAAFMARRPVAIRPTITAAPAPVIQISPVSTTTQTTSTQVSSPQATASAAAKATATVTTPLASASASASASATSTITSTTTAQGKTVTTVASSAPLAAGETIQQRIARMLAEAQAQTAVI